MAKVANVLDVPENQVRYRIDKWQIPKRNRQEARVLHSEKEVNEDFFSEWSDEMAYVLGWVLSDGNLRSTKSTLRIRIQEGDREVLEKIASVMGLTNGVRMQMDKGKPSYELSIGRPKIKEDLIALGVKPGHRVYDQPRLDIPKPYVRHFIRGFFDGDGCVHYRSPEQIGYGRGRIMVLLGKASEDLMTWVHQEIDDAIPFTVSFRAITLNRPSPYYNLSISSWDGCNAFYHWLYADVQNSLWLDRKYETFRKVFGEVM